MNNSFWTEEEYLAYLKNERRLFAWTLRKHGNYSTEEAEKQAMEFYEYEQPTNPYRELIFHDPAWHWAMIAIHGHGYWWDRPELWPPPDEYHEA